MRTVLAGDLGGTKCRFALVGEDFSVLRVQHVPTSRVREPFLQALTTAITAVVTDLPPGTERPAAAGFGTAGVIPRDGRSITYAPNLPLDHFPLALFVEERFGTKTTLLNDGRASAWGEYLRGHATGRDPLLCLFFGTGIGIGLIADGRPFAGGTNAAGEIGHTTFRPNGRRCACGGLGHFEAYCGGRAINERSAELLGPRASGAWTVQDLVAVARGDGADAGHARSILDEAEQAACTLVANACTLLNPSACVLGGGVMSAWPSLHERIVAHVRASTSEPIWRDLQFAPTLGGSDAILWGAAAATGVLWPARP